MYWATIAWFGLATLHSVGMDMPESYKDRKYQVNQQRYELKLQEKQERDEFEKYMREKYGH